MAQLNLNPGVYVVAVSGGVDSMVLLDLLADQGQAKLIVAHFDHGIRDDSESDRLFVQKKAKAYGLPFIYDTGHLGKGVSEEKARDARYAFLRSVQGASGARAIITAHHEDDVLETAIINLMRGTGRKGLSSLQSTQNLYRPLLGTSKQGIIAYAKAHHIEWHEDSTNSDPTYLRNHIRLNVMPRITGEARQTMKRHTVEASRLNKEIDQLLKDIFASRPDPNMIDRHWFVMLPHAVAREVLVAWLRDNEGATFDKRTIERMVTQLKTLSPGKTVDVNGTWYIVVKSDNLALVRRDR